MVAESLTLAWIGQVVDVVKTAKRMNQDDRQPVVSQQMSKASTPGLVPFLLSCKVLGLGALARHVVRFLATGKTSRKMLSPK